MVFCAKNKKKLKKVYNYLIILCIFVANILTAQLSETINLLWLMMYSGFTIDNANINNYQNHINSRKRNQDET